MYVCMIYHVIGEYYFWVYACLYIYVCAYICVILYMRTRTCLFLCVRIWTIKYS